MTAICYLIPQLCTSRYRGINSIVIFGVCVKHASAVRSSAFIFTGAEIFAIGEFGSFRANELISESSIFTFAGSIPFHGEGWVFRAGRDTIFIERWFTKVLFGVSGVKSDNRENSMIFEEVFIVGYMIEA